MKYMMIKIRISGTNDAIGFGPPAAGDAIGPAAEDSESFREQAAAATTTRRLLQ